MTSLTNSLGTESYAYRAYGMRVSKANGANGTTYRYDGQMAMEDVDTGSNPAVTDYAIGARGIDAISKTVGSNTTVVYPLYDAHGNMMADVSRNGLSFSINDKRSYDAWGNIRNGSTSGDPKGRYCANLGHKQDDESGLIYMRARYYEPTSGRFLSEDPSHQGSNWFCYVDNNPTFNVDPTGRWSNFDTLTSITVLLSTLAVLSAAERNLEQCVDYLNMACWFAVFTLWATDADPGIKAAMTVVNGIIEEQKAIIESGLGTLEENAETSLLAAVVCQQMVLDIAAVACAIVGD